MIVDAAVYEHGRRIVSCDDVATAAGLCKLENRFAWVGMADPTAEEVASVQHLFALPRHAVEDALRHHDRPKIEAYDGTVFLVVKPARYVDSEEVVELGELALFASKHAVVAIRRGVDADIGQLRRDLESTPEDLALGPGAVVFALLDRVIDQYLVVLGGVDNDISQVEATVFSQDGQNPTERIFKLKREVLDFHRAANALIEPLERLANTRFEMLDPELRPQFKDLELRLLRVVEEVQSFRELLTSALEANLTQVGIRQNEDMRKISAWAAMITVPTMIAGIYGMNFRHMPELAWVGGYPGALAIMAVACLLLYRWFRRSGWL